MGDPELEKKLRSDPTSSKAMVDFLNRDSESQARGMIGLGGQVEASEIVLDAIAEMVASEPRQDERSITLGLEPSFSHCASIPA